MGVPGSCTTCTMLDLNEADTALDKSAGRQQLHAKVLGLSLVDTIQRLRFRGLFGKVDRFGNRLLHAEC